MKKDKLYETLALFAIKCNAAQNKKAQDQVIESIIDELEINFEPDCEACNDTGTVEYMVYTNNEPDGFDDKPCPHC